MLFSWVRFDFVRIRLAFSYYYRHPCKRPASDKQAIWNMISLNKTRPSSNTSEIIKLYDKLKDYMVYWWILQAQYVSNDPSYLNCNKSECSKTIGDDCALRTCSGSITFHYINIRTDLEFVFFTGGFDTPCILKRSQPLKFANPNMPLYGHLSSVDSTGTSVSRNYFKHSIVRKCYVSQDVTVVPFLLDEGNMGQWR